MFANIFNDSNGNDTGKLHRTSCSDNITTLLMSCWDVNNTVSADGRHEFYASDNVDTISQIIKDIYKVQDRLRGHKYRTQNLHIQQAGPAVEP